METLRIPSGGVKINGVVYLAAGAGPHPTLVLCHGCPGNEKNLDLAQAVRRAGWNVVTFNYRGAWGSPGSFRFTQNPQDAEAMLAYLREPKNAAKLKVDPKHLAMIGHSMGGWVTAIVASKDEGLIGAGLISAANMGLLHDLGRETLIKLATESEQALADTSPTAVADELISNLEAFDFTKAAPGLALRPLLILSSEDSLAPHTEVLIEAARKNGGVQVTHHHVATDHSWSDRRIDLSARAFVG
jgi:uncharacterized protein